MPTSEDLVRIMDSMLAAAKRGAPFPLGPMCDFWVPVHRLVKNLRYAQIYGDPDQERAGGSCIIDAIALLTVGLVARDALTGTPLFQVMEAGCT